MKNHLFFIENYWKLMKTHEFSGKPQNLFNIMSFFVPKHKFGLDLAQKSDRFGTEI